MLYLTNPCLSVSCACCLGFFSCSTIRIAADVQERDSRRAMKSDRPQDSPLFVTTMLAKGTSPRGRSRRTKSERGRETGTINTGFVASQLPSYVTVPLLAAAEVRIGPRKSLKRDVSALLFWNSPADIW